MNPILATENLNLLVHNIVFLAGGALNIFLPLIVLYIRRKRLDSAIITFWLMSWSVGIFQIFQVLGANAATADLSRRLFMFNLTDIWIGAFMTHWFLAVIGKDRDLREKKILAFIYTFAIVLFGACLIFPRLFLMDSVPKMYFPFYYNPGPLYGVMVAYFFITQIYYFSKLIVAYRHEQEPVLKNRYRYVLIAMLYAYATGQLAFLLVFNIKVDPMWASFVGLYPLLLAYAMVRYQLMEVRVIIQRAFIYALTVAVLIGFISFSNYASAFLEQAIPGFPYWAVPAASSLVGVALGFFIWGKLRENDLLKYEFVTIMAHKFRTPLTQIKWSAEELRPLLDKPSTVGIVDTIEQADAKLVDLTGTLIRLTDTEGSSENAYYAPARIDLRGLMDSIAKSYEKAYADNEVSLEFTYKNSNAIIHIDEEGMRFVLQTLLENALAYTPNGGKVTVTVTSSRNKVFISVADTGIGIGKRELPLIFSKFYRSHGAKKADTEGFGIGLYLAQSIVRRHGGAIEASSEGENRGSLFTVTLPLVK